MINISNKCTVIHLFYILDRSKNFWAMHLHTPISLHQGTKYEIFKRSHRALMCSSEFLKQCVISVRVLSMDDDMECEKNYSKIQVHTKYE